MRDGKVIIRKYENRRLYDTTHSRYVNLEEVAAMIRQGAEVQVLDARTGEDITRLVLTQIIVEDAKDNDSALPLDFLQQLVAASGRAGQESFARYFNTVFDSYRRAYEAFQSRLQANPVSTPFDYVQSFFAPPPRAAAPPPAPPPEGGERRNAATSEAELDELRRRVAELERRLAEPRRAAPRGSKRA